MNTQTTTQEKTSILERMVGKDVWVETHGKRGRAVKALDEEHLLVLYYNDTDPKKEKVNIFELRSA
jgi:hypothetical protein